MSRGFSRNRTEVVKLNTNENPYPPSPAVMKAIAEIKAGAAYGGILTRWVMRFGRRRRKSTALSRTGLCAATAETICCEWRLRAFCDRRRPVAYPVPTYSLYPVLANIQNCKAIEVPFDEEFNLPAQIGAGAGGLDDCVQSECAERDIYRSRRSLRNLAAEIKGVLLIDEAYVDFAERNCAELVKQFDNVIILRSLSKGYSLRDCVSGMRLPGRK